MSDLEEPKPVMAHYRFSSKNTDEVRVYFDGPGSRYTARVIVAGGREGLTVFLNPRNLTVYTGNGAPLGAGPDPILTLPVAAIARIWIFTNDGRRGFIGGAE